LFSPSYNSLSVNTSTEYSIKEFNDIHVKCLELYLISKEPISQLDWALVKWGTNISGKDLFEVAQCTKIGPGGIHYFDEMSMAFGSHELIAQKVIATTDLKICLINGRTHFNENGIPKIGNISRKFLETFISEYIKGAFGKHTDTSFIDVMVEYNNPITEIPKVYEPYATVQWTDGTLKIDSDNFVNLSFPKSQFTKADLHNAFCNGAGFDQSTLEVGQDYYLFTEWFNKNIL
jgi:hypothetical protein